VDTLISVIVFVVVVALVAVGGIRLGMLVATRIDRLGEPTDEEQGADDD
jgi:hypothetical protein